MGSVTRAMIASLMLLLPLGIQADAQETTGTIFGTLVDQTGGVLPGVKVVITRVDTGQTREVVTNGVGQYTASLPIGNYEISFVLPKFQPFTARGISLHVNDRLQVNGRLLVGAVETMTVTAERLVQRTSDVRGMIPQVAVRELPTLTRTLVQLVTLVPGVSSDLREEACFCDQGNLDISINGARRSGVNWLLDGASNVNVWNNYTLVTTPSLEAIAEINVITSSYTAEWARNGGGVVNAVTKSGTNRFSGSAYHFLRNDALNANSFFRNMDPRADVNSSPRRLRYNNFGYTLGGPALPGRKKLFFFFSQEWRRNSRDKRTIWSSVPDPAWLTDASSPEYVPPEARDPNAVKLLSLWRAPNVPGANLYRTTIGHKFDTRQEFVRADYNVSTNWTTTGRYLHDQVDSRGEYITPDVTPGHRYQVGHLAVMETRHVRGRLLGEFAYQLSTHELSSKDGTHSRGDVGVLIPEVFPENRANLIPTIDVSGLDQIGSLPPSNPREYLNQTFSSALSWQHGTHTLKAGGLFTLEHMNSNLDRKSTQGAFAFQPGGGFTAFQNFLRGNSGGACGESCIYSETDVDVINRFRFRRYEAFVQDTWRVHPAITLDLGLRYAFHPPLTDVDDKLFTFSPEAYDPTKVPTFADPDFGDFLVVGTGNLFNGIRVAGKDSPHGRAIYPADKNNLQPRIGGAWDPGGAGRLVVRAAYGVYFDQTHAALFAQNVQSPFAFPFADPFRTDAFVWNPTLSNPGAGWTGPPYAVLTAQPYATSDRFVAPRRQHWNLGMQRRLYSRGMLDVGYVGGRGDHLLRYLNINQPPATSQGELAPNLVRPFPGYDAIFMRETTARSNYHGLVSSFRHDAGGAGSATVNYTFSRNKTDATYDNDEIDNPQNVLDKDAEYGAAGTDRAHIFTASYVYRPPFARAATGGWTKALLHGWQIAGIIRIESGPAVRVRVANCNFGGWCVPDPLRPDQVGQPGAGDQPGLLWFNPAAFEPPPPRAYGTAPVAPFRLPGRHQWDFSVSKTVSVIGASRLQFRADLINAFNQTQFLDVSTDCFALSDTTTCSNTLGPSGFGKVTSTRPPREIQLGIRLDW